MFQPVIERFLTLNYTRIGTSSAVAKRTNVQIIQDAYSEAIKGNRQGVGNLCTQDVTWGSFKNEGVPYAGMYYGCEGMPDFFKSLAESVAYKNFEAKEFFSQGDDVFVLGHEEVVVKETGGTYGDD